MAETGSERALRHARDGREHPKGPAVCSFLRSRGGDTPCAVRQCPGVVVGAIGTMILLRYKSAGG